MKCTICDVEMVIGKTLSPYMEKGIIYYSQRIGNAETIQLVDCQKCPVCGNSKPLTAQETVNTPIGQ